MRPRADGDGRVRMSDKIITKVLIWWAAKGGTAEQMLNEWLAKNSDIEIITVTQSEAGNVTVNRRITYTIWYKN